MKTHPRSLTLTRNGLTVACDFGKDGRLERKIERLDGKRTEFSYTFDGKGHLLDVRRDNSLVEVYRYNAQGQRTTQRCFNGGSSADVMREYSYDAAGRLVQAGRASFSYDRNGALSQRHDDAGSTFFRYDGDTRLDKVLLPDGGEIRYEYYQANPLNPSRRFKSGRLTHQYAWRDPLRLAACLDHDAGLEYQFTYDQEGRLDRLRLLNLGTSARDSVRGLFGNSSAPLEFLCCTDQVGTLRALIKADTARTNSWTTADVIAEAFAKAASKKGKGAAWHMPTGAPNPNGELTGWAVKEIRRDSFGNPYYDNFPDFFPPIGFAGGLTDPDTGLVRFGWRDYDPTVGRFTAPDPLGDTGGDHDLYDYCVDDPVGLCDPEGLIPLPLLFLAGIMGSLGLGLGTTYGAATVVDAIDGEESTAARDAVKTVAPYVYNIHTNAFLPGQIGLGAVTKGVGPVLGIKAASEFVKYGKNDSNHPKY